MRSLTKIIVFVLLLGGCTLHNSNEAKILSQEKFKEVLIDIHMVEGIKQAPSVMKKYNLSSDTLYNSVYKKHGITQQDFDSTVAYYSKNRPKKYDQIYENILEQLSKMEGELSKEIKAQKKKK